MFKPIGTIIAVAAAATLTLFATSADAQNRQNCAPRDAVIERLADGYGETRQSVGIGNNNAIVEVFASEETGTWTITVTAPGGLTCLVASGQSYENLNEELPNLDSDA